MIRLRAFENCLSFIDMEFNDAKGQISGLTEAVLVFTTVYTLNTRLYSSDENGVSLPWEVLYDVISNCV